MAITAGATPVSGLWVQAYILKKFVDMLKDELVFATYSEPATIKGNAGAYVARWLIPVVHRGSTTVITEASAGTVGEITGTTINKVEATVNTYGEWFKIGQIAAESDIPGTLDVYTEQMMFAGSSAIDLLLRAAAAATTNLLNSGDLTANTGSLAAGDFATAQDFSAIAGFFHSKNAKGFPSLMGDYVWIMHPEQETDMTTEVTTGRIAWADVNKNVPAGWDVLIKNHRFVGRYGGVTAVRTTMIQTVTQTVTAHKSVALARYGLGWAGLGKEGASTPEIKHKRPGPNDTSQPLDLYETLAWKVLQCERMLDANRVLIVYSNRRAN